MPPTFRREQEKLTPFDTPTSGKTISYSKIEDVISPLSMNNNTPLQHPRTSPSSSSKRGSIKGDNSGAERASGSYSSRIMDDPGDVTTTTVEEDAGGHGSNASPSSSGSKTNDVSTSSSSTRSSRLRQRYGDGMTSIPTKSRHPKNSNNGNSIGKSISHAKDAQHSIKSHKDQISKDKPVNKTLSVYNHSTINKENDKGSGGNLMRIGPIGKPFDEGDDDDTKNRNIDNTKMSKISDEVASSLIIREDTLPTEKQLVLLCLDYLRHMVRSYNPAELLQEEGIRHDNIVKSVECLNGAFATPSENANSNDNNVTLMDDNAEKILRVGANKISDNSNDCFFLTSNGGSPSSVSTSSRRNANDEDETINATYAYDDTHYSNAHRFYTLNGLSADTNPLSLGEIAASGLVGLGARSRLTAETDFCTSELFVQFVDAVKSKGFFRQYECDVDEQEEDEVEMAKLREGYRDRYHKVVAKFRVKLADKQAMLDERHPLLSPMSDMSHFTDNSESNVSPTRQLAMRMAEKQKSKLKNPKRAFFPGSEKGEVDETEKKETVHDADDKADNKEEDSLQETENRLHVDAEQEEEHETKSVEHNDEEDARTQPQKAAARAMAIQQEHLKELLEETEKHKMDGNRHMLSKDFDRAINSYSTAIKLYPSGPTSHVYFSNRSAAYLSLKRYQDAVYDSERALALRPDYGKAHSRLGWANYCMGQYRLAMESYGMAIKLDPENAPSHRNYYNSSKSRLLATDDDESASRSSHHMMPQHTNPQRQLGVKDNLRTPRRRGIDEHLLLSAQSFNSSANVSVSTQDVMGEESDDGRERLLCQKEADQFKSQGNAYMSSRQYDKAVESYTGAIEACPNGTSAYVYFANRAAALCYLEKYKDAESDAQRSVELNPIYGKAHARLGLSRFFLKDFEGAVAAYENALKYEPNNNASLSYLNKAKAKVHLISGTRT